MNRGLVTLCMVAALLVLGQSTTAYSQSVNQKVEDVKPLTPTPQTRAQRLDFLFDELKSASTVESAQRTESLILEILDTSEDVDANRLSAQAKIAVMVRSIDVAITLLSDAITLKPDFVGALNFRASLYFRKGDLTSSLSDIAQVLKQEPRHFRAIAGYGSILMLTGQRNKALQVFRRALAIYPHMQDVTSIGKILEKGVEGKDL